MYSEDQELVELQDMSAGGALSDRWQADKPTLRQAHCRPPRSGVTCLQPLTLALWNPTLCLQLLQAPAGSHPRAEAACPWRISTFVNSGWLSGCRPRPLTEASTEVVEHRRIPRAQGGWLVIGNLHSPCLFCLAGCHVSSRCAEYHTSARLRHAHPERL